MYRYPVKIIHRYEPSRYFYYNLLIWVNENIGVSGEKFTVLNGLGMVILDFYSQEDQMLCLLRWGDGQCVVAGDTE